MASRKLIVIKVGVISLLLIIFTFLLNLINYYLGYNNQLVSFIGSCLLALIISHLWDYLLLTKHNNKQDRQIKSLDTRVTTIEKIIKGFK